MGADLIITTLAHRKDTTLDWGKGRAFVQDNRIPNEVLEEADPMGEAEDYEEAEGSFLNYITTLENHLEHDRTVTTRLIHGSWVYIIGGTSWGDSPGDVYDAAVVISQWDPLLKAIGFLTWDEMSEPQP